MEDEAIIALFNERSENAITELTAKYGRRAMAVAVGILGDTRDAEECVSDGAHVLWQQIPPEKPVYLGAYFARVVRNLSACRLEHRSAAKRDRGCEVCLEELEGCLSTGTDPERLLESRQIRQVINAFLDTLDKKNRIIFVRRYFYFDSCADIARHLGMTRGAVNTRLSRLRDTLGALLEKEEIKL